MNKLSPLQKLRLEYIPNVAPLLVNLNDVVLKPTKTTPKRTPQIAALFPLTAEEPELELAAGKKIKTNPLNVGVVFSGGQAPGGHNVVTALFDGLKTLNKDSKLFGFLDGPIGIIKGRYLELKEDILAHYYNQGGFDLLGSGRNKIEKEEEIAACRQVVERLNLDALIIIGGDDSNTNAAILAEYFAKNKVKTAVIGVPKTIDGDLRSDRIEISFGFDTATKTYSETIGNLMRDALSAKKYTFFVKLMGRSASHIALECALKTHPNLCLIAEEVAAKKMTLKDVVILIANHIAKRCEKGKEYGVILIPEGLIEFIDEIKHLIAELNNLLAHSSENITGRLTNAAKACFDILPSETQKQLLLSRDAHGNVQVSKIETDRLLMELVVLELEKRRKEGTFKGSFSFQPLFLGYEGRSCLPSNFDCDYCSSLGRFAALLAEAKANGYICAITHLKESVGSWKPIAFPITAMMGIEKRSGKEKPVIQKALVDMESEAFKAFAKGRSDWELDDDYEMPGPIQFFGPAIIVESKPKTL